MAEITTIPFGPQHPVLPEPVHLDLELKDEKVVRAVPSIGYVHRGLEKLVEKRDFKQFTFVAERVCGICSFGHGWGYVKAVEGLMQIEVPRRASYLRTLWHELSRIHSHLLWLGLAADAMGFESLFMHAWRLRETVLDLFEETTGGRVIFSVCSIGGVRRDLTDTMKKDIAEKMRKLRKELHAPERYIRIRQHHPEPPAGRRGPDGTGCGRFRLSGTHGPRQRRAAGLPVCR
jgi:ech hydrogenase subunit E